MSKEQLKELRIALLGCDKCKGQWKQCPQCGFHGWTPDKGTAVEWLDEIDRLSMALEQAVKLTGLELDSDVIDAHGCSGAPVYEAPELVACLKRVQ